LARLGLADRVVTKQCAAADVDGLLHLAVNRDHPGDHRLTNESGVPIRARRLDSLWREAGFPRISLVKIDVQGAEAKVLAGATAMVESDRPAVFH
jgi:FkbM family methyltransferase